MKAKILEIFQSIQGEGPYAGTRQVFVRFFECNMHCTWCDTPHSIGDTTRHYKEMSLEDVKKKIFELSDDVHSVSLTGGEPLVQKDFIKALLPELKKRKLRTYLDTNGIFYNELSEIIKNIDIVAMDIKLPSSTKCQDYWKEHLKFLKVARKKELFIKTVISNETTKDDVVKAAKMVAKIDKNLLFILQPNFFDMKHGVIAKCAEYQKDCLQVLKDVRIVPQMHKFLKVR